MIAPYLLHISQSTCLLAVVNVTQVHRKQRRLCLLKSLLHKYLFK